MAKRSTIINSVALDDAPAKTAEVGKPLVIQLAPFGEYPNVIDEEDEGGNTVQRDVIQKVDEEAIDSLVANFGEKVLVDADHSSALSHDTRAMAWVTRLFKDPEKGLMAEIEPTSEGVEKIKGMVYRFVSAEWTLQGESGDEIRRPLELVAVGLTNRPNLPVAPMLNSKAAKNAEPGTPPDDKGASVTAQGAVEPAKPAGQGATPEGAPPAKETQKQEPPNTKESQSMEIQAIKDKLGLPAEATDEEVGAAIDALIAKCGAFEQVQNALGLEATCSNDEVMEALNAVLKNCGDLQARNAEIEEAQKDAEAEKFVADNADDIPDEAVDEVKEQYKADPAAAEKTVANFRLAMEKRERVINARVDAAAKAQKAQRHFVADNSKAQKPTALNMKARLDACNGDPAAVCKALEDMADGK